MGGYRHVHTNTHVVVDNIQSASQNHLPHFRCWVIINIIGLLYKAPTLLEKQKKGNRNLFKDVIMFCHCVHSLHLLGKGLSQLTRFSLIQLIPSSCISWLFLAVFVTAKRASQRGAADYHLRSMSCCPLSVGLPAAYLNSFLTCLVLEGSQM